MRSSTVKAEATDYPEFAVRAETIGKFFSPPLASSTFYDLVNKGKVVPLKGIRGFYKLNDSLRRLGLREVPKLPFETPARTSEEIIRLAFCVMDPETFEAPSWLLNVEAIDASDLHHAQAIIALHGGHVDKLHDDISKRGYLQGVLDAAAMSATDQSSAE